MTVSRLRIKKLQNCSLVRTTGIFIMSFLKNEGSISVGEDDAMVPPPVVEESGSGAPLPLEPTSLHRTTRSTQGMESSILRFQNVNFIVGKKGQEKNILTDVSGTVKWGHVLAVMGPSGAGKTTLISALTLEALYGKAVGEVTLNGVPLTDEIFKTHCYVVKQHDKHWPYLTCRETLRFAAELFNVAPAVEDMDFLVDEVMQKMGLLGVAEVRNSSLSGGQRRRLSIGMALLKQPTLLLLDEPTSGLDAAASSSIMTEIVRLAREERLVVLCTIHQPSSKVYNGFDQQMLLSRGRIAFTGDVSDAVPYFTSIGYPCPPATNPAEFFLDLVNSDFSDESAVTNLLDTWEEKRPDAGSSHHKRTSLLGQEGVTETKRAPLSQEMSIMLRRHFLLVIRDPILYLGRCIIFLVSCLIFGLVYWNGRDFTQDQAINKLWVSIWFVAVPSNMGVVAVYALNDEFRSVLRESKNGMLSPLSYVLAKTIIVLPIFFLFAIIALGIPMYAVQNAEPSTFGTMMIMFASLMFVFEAVAECLAVWVDDPILGMLNYMNFWFASFLFGGFMIPLQDLYWPFKLFYYIMPYSYYVRSAIYEQFSAATFEPCFESGASAVCTEETDGLSVLGGLSQVFPLLSTTSQTVKDIGIILAIGAFYKICYIVGVYYKSTRVAKFVEK